MRSFIGCFVLIIVLSACGGPRPTGTVEALTAVPMTLAPVRTVSTASGVQSFATATVSRVQPSMTPTARQAALLTKDSAPNHPLEISELIQVAPEDIVSEMALFVGGGGGEYYCADPPENGTTLQMRLPGTVLFRYCRTGQEADNTLRLTVSSPDRGIETEKLEVRSQGTGGEFRPYLDGFYPVDLSRLVGKYVFTLDGKTTHIQFTVEFLPAVLPVVYEVFTPPYLEYRLLDGQHHRLHLAGFAPNEQLKLLAYQKDFGETKYILLGWYPLLAGEDGQAWVDLNMPVGTDKELAVSIIGTSSGEVPLIKPDAVMRMVESMEAFRATCPGSNPPRLALRKNFRAIEDIPTGFATQMENGTYAISNLQIVSRVDAYGVVQGGPICFQGSNWWMVIFEKSGARVYAPESIGDRYILEPVEP